MWECECGRTDGTDGTAGRTVGRSRVSGREDSLSAVLNSSYMSVKGVRKE